MTSDSGKSGTTTSSRYVEQIRADSRLLKRAPLLGHLDIELTERCNNRCRHCFINLPADDRAAEHHEMTADEVKSILTEAADLGCMSVRFTGGEPLLRDDFAELYLFTRRLGIKVTLFTNATLLTPELADLFARVPPGAAVEVSVYGMKPESYEAVSRRPGSYEAFRRGVELLVARRVQFTVKGVFLPPEQDELAEFERWAATLPGGNEPAVSTALLDMRGRRDSPARNREIAGLRVSAEQGVALLNRHRERYRQDMREFCSKFIGPAGNRLFTCGAGKGGVCVDAYGSLQACLLLRHPVTVYDRRAGSLKEALTGFLPALRETRAANSDYLARCGRCFLKGLCEQCPAKSWMEHGTLDTPVEYHCRVAHARARDLGLLAENEQSWEVADWRARIARLSPERSR